jgi:hypothetical protein
MPTDALAFWLASTMEAAVVALTVVLVVITAYYAWQTRLTEKEMREGRMAADAARRRDKSEACRTRVSYRSPAERAGTGSRRPAGSSPPCLHSSASLWAAPTTLPFARYRLIAVRR